MNDPANNQAKRKIRDILHRMKVGFLVTQHEDGSMHGRPMAVHHTDFDGTVWLLTDRHSEKIADIKNIDHVMVTYSDPDNQRFVSLSGRATVVTDRDAIREQWMEPERIWFPEGPDDTNLVAIRLDADHAEYWDTEGRGVDLALGYAKALLTGSPSSDEGDTGRADYRAGH